MTKKSSVTLHNAAMTLADKAKRYQDRANGLYLKAARKEEKALKAIPEDRSRTRNIIAVSAMTFYSRSGNSEEEWRFIHEYEHLLSEPPPDGKPRRTHDD